MSESNTSRPDPNATLDRLRKLVRGGGRPPLDNMTREEMAAAGELIRRGEAVIGSAACRPILQANLH